MIILTACVLLAIAMLVGGWLASRLLRGLPVAAGATRGHAGLAVAGVIALAVAAVTGPLRLPVNAALLLFLLALFGGGFVLLFRREFGSAPGFMVALHAACALVGGLVLTIGLIR